MAEAMPIKNSQNEYPMTDTIRNLSYSFEQSAKDENEQKLDLTVDDEEESLKQEIEQNYAKIYQTFINSTGKKSQKLDIDDLTEEEDLPHVDHDEITNILSANLQSQESLKKEIERIQSPIKTDEILILRDSQTMIDLNDELHFQHLQALQSQILKLQEMLREAQKNI